MIRSSSRPVRSATLSIGSRAFVNCPGEPSRRVTLSDDAGKSGGESLRDGCAVEITAWRPRGSGTRYRIRVAPEGVEGWVGAESLRAALVPAAEPPPLIPGPRKMPDQRVHDTRRKFGQ